MVIKEAIDLYGDRLREGILILSHLMGVDKSYIYTYIDRELDKEIEKDFIAYMDMIVDDYPIHYILGERDFMGLNFYVEEGVLIPRSDTEILVQFLIEKSKEFSKAKVLEIGSGTGIISNSLAYYNRDARVIGIDISQKAYENSMKNKARHGLENVEFFLGDLFGPVANRGEKFDFIVSNPPYIKKDVIQDLDKNVKDYEPHLALDGGDDGLDFYRKITGESVEYLNKTGYLVYEIAYDQGEEVSEILRANGYKPKILKDLEGRDRVVYGVFQEVF